MLVCGAGDIHGAIDELYRQVLAFEFELGQRFAAVLHVGDFGIWPDAERIDRASRRHGGAGDYPRWLKENRTAPRRTIFIPGNHEDFEYLAPHSQPTELLKDLWYLPSGSSTVLETDAGRIRIGGVGGCYGAEDYPKAISRLSGKERRHYTREHIARLISRSTRGRLDVLMIHDAPTGVLIPRLNNRGMLSEAQGLSDLIGALRPRVCLFGHHHARFNAQVHGVNCVGLNKGPCPGSLVAIDIPCDGEAWQIIAEWPKK